MADALTVQLAERSYSIQFGATLTAEVHAQVEGLEASGRKVAILTDRNVATKQAEALRAMFGGAPTLALAPGERSKSLKVLGQALDFLVEQGMDRRSALFAVGGGVIGDLGGFAAAVFLRGIDVFQVPTTLLAMVDSSVGGKTGINLTAGKNLAGAFHQPRGVFIATGLLGTLPVREFAAGMGEVIKYGLLGDEALFARLEQAPLTIASDDLSSVIRRCCALKARIVESDERELAPGGGRALLNLGHTFGHAVEQATGFTRYLHGEAVGIGLAAAARLSARAGLIGPGEIARVDAVLAAHALRSHLAEPLAVGDLMAAMMHDKKVRAGRLRFVLLNRLGAAEIRDDVPSTDVEAAWRDVGAT